MRRIGFVVALLALCIGCGRTGRVDVDGRVPRAPSDEGTVTGYHSVGGEWSSPKVKERYLHVLMNGGENVKVVAGAEHYGADGPDHYGADRVRLKRNEQGEWALAEVLSWRGRKK